MTERMFTRHVGLSSAVWGNKPVPTCWSRPEAQLPVNALNLLRESPHKEKRISSPVVPHLGTRRLHRCSGPELHTCVSSDSLEASLSQLMISRQLRVHTSDLLRCERLCNVSPCERGKRPDGVLAQFSSAQQSEDEDEDKQFKLCVPDAVRESQETRSLRCLLVSSTEINQLSLKLRNLFLRQLDGHDLRVFTVNNMSEKLPAA
ncbi:unnamed protein product [Pleuronectes platessa]|uniref:Uncharacterized protein n=1 Tax=Pleuronectes platessa TaxID=8262 RepID=A0A9N7YDS8_PLEPL|nr:unnamed protein product [Pleuronectes platessa]